MLEMSLALLPLTPFINWPVFLILTFGTKEIPFSKALYIMRALSFTIAMLSSIYALFVIARAFQLEFYRDFAILLLVSPVWAFTMINAVFLYLTYRKKW